MGRCRRNCKDSKPYLASACLLSHIVLFDFCWAKHHIAMSFVLVLVLFVLFVCLFVFFFVVVVVVVVAVLVVVVRLIVVMLVVLTLYEGSHFLTSPHRCETFRENAASPGSFRYPCSFTTDSRVLEWGAPDQGRVAWKWSQDVFQCLPQELH